MTTLQTLVLNDRFDQVKDVLELVKALRSLSALKRFELNGGGYAACHVRDIIMACCSSPSHQFETLHLKMAGHQYSNSLLEWGNKGVVDSLINMPATHILDLNIKLGSWHLEKHILIPLLGRCPLLERLCIDVECEGTTAELTQFFQSGKCRKIKHLSIGAIRTVDHDYHYDDLSDDFVHTTTPYAGDMDLIQSLGKGVVLTEGEVVPAAAPRISRRGLESLAVHRGLEFFDPQQDSLIVTRLHGETLLHLDLKRVGMEEFSSLVHGLPKLQSLKAEVVSKRPYALHHHPSQFLTLQWACQSLTKLDLFLSFVATGGVSSASILENNSIMAERILDSMTSQIGEMKQLRELQLKVKSWDVLKLEHGHLDRLSGLRRLQTLEYSITPEMSTCWGVEQAEWMLNHWPCLVAVVLKGKGTTRFQEIMLAERPWMCIRQS
ncbi:hypothetical protein EDD11_002505 [Mortierella claussenii]|nr:hypothetical protein EDD11_002505 [Mortierella claussenii]